MSALALLVGEIERLRGVLATLRADISPTADANPFGLSRREFQVLRLVAQGYSYRQIGMELDIALRTVRVHAFNSYRKIGVRKQIHAARWAWKHGLISVDDAWASVQKLQGLIEERHDTT